MKKLNLSHLKLNALKPNECFYINGGCVDINDCGPHITAAEVETDDSRILDSPTTDELIDKLPVTSDTRYC